MGDSLELIEKYKARLDPSFDSKKILRALQKLNELNMTIELLQTTRIGIAVNGLKKKEGLGDFAKEIVYKWKKLLPNGVETKKKSSMEYTPTVKTEPAEYDPTQTWETSEMQTITSPYKPSVKQEPGEYDPSQNWKLKSSKKRNSSGAHTADSVKIKQEKDAPVEKQKKKKRKENGRVVEKEIRKDYGAGRDSETRRKIKQEKSKKVKVEKESSERKTSFNSTNKDDIEEYDPQCNFELQSPPTYDPGSPETRSEYEPSSRNQSIEYDPGPANTSSNYKPCSTSDLGSPRVNGQEDDDSHEEDEPGAYLLHPKRASFERSGHSSEHSAENEEDSVDPSSVLSTTLYSRNKSVDSEEGSWGSYANGESRQVGKGKGRLLSIEETDDAASRSERTAENETRKYKNREKDSQKKSNSEKKKMKNSKHSEKSVNLDTKNYVSSNNKPVKVKKEKEEIYDKKQKGKSNETIIKKEASSKRKSTSSKNEEPAKKKAKCLEVKKEKIKPKDAGFLFEDIPDVSKAKKKKKKKSLTAKESNTGKSKVSRDSSTMQKPAAQKLDLHLPEIQTTYRPLPTLEKKSERRYGELKLTDNQAAELHSTRQTKKMLVYSGGGGGFLPKMMSLYDQCMSVLQNNIDAIDVIGGIPYEIIKPVLERSTPEQLYRLEDSNPYLLEDTDSLWEKHARQEFKGKRPDELESWRELFLRLHDEREAKLLNLTQMIQAKEAKKKPLEKKVLLAYVGMSAKAPRSVRRAQEKYGTGVKKSSFASHSSGSSSVASAVRREITESRMSVPVGSITAATVDRETRLNNMKDMKKARVAPMMAKTLKSIGRLKYRR